MIPNEWADLEPQQYATLYADDDAPLPDLRRSYLRVRVYIGAALFILLLLAGFGLRFPDEINLPFVLRATIPERIYRYPYPVYVEASFVENGKSVRAGDALVRISSPEIVTLISAERAAAAALENFRRHWPLPGP